MKVVCFGASTSKKSINKQLAYYAGSLLSNAEVETLDLNDFEAPIFSVDLAAEIGFPDNIVRFKEKLKTCDGVIVSFAEHNGAYSAAFKNILDWTSRMEGKTWEGKPFFIMATSPGGRGGSNALELVASTFPYQGAEVTGQFSLPNFHQNFSVDSGITDPNLDSKFREEFSKFKTALGYSN